MRRPFCVLTAWMIAGLLSIAASSFAANAASEPTDAELEAMQATVVRKAGRIVELRAEADGFTPEDYRRVGSCTSLKKLSLSGKTLDDATLPLLAGLVELEEFSTNNTQLSDQGYRHFAAMVKLKKLALFHPSWDRAEFTGEGLAHLKDLPHLERLTFAGTTTGDRAFEAIGTLTQLKELHFWHTMHTPAGNEHLKKLTNLTVLRIGQRLPRGNPPPPPSFDAATIKLIAAMPSLERIELFEAVFTADDLLPLKQLPRLKALKISQTDITLADVETLRAAMVGVKVEHLPITEEDRAATLVKKLKLEVLPTSAAPATAAPTK